MSSLAAKQAGTLFFLFAFGVSSGGGEVWVVEILNVKEVMMQ